MIKSKMLTIVPKNNHDELTFWCFAVEDRELAEQTLKEEYPDGTHEIIEVDCEEFESLQEQEEWCSKHDSYRQTEDYICIMLLI